MKNLLFTTLATSSAAVLLAGCSLGTIEVDVSPDLSGRLELTRYDIRDEIPGPVLAGLSGATPTRVGSFTMKRSQYNFERLRELAIGGIKFEVEDHAEDRGDGEIRLKVRIPLSPNCEWLRLLEIDDAKVTAARKLFRDRPKEAKFFSFLAEEELMGVELHLKLPGNIRSKKVSGTTERAESWVQKRAPGGDVPPNELRVKIPLDAVRQGGGEVAVFEIVFSKHAGGSLGREEGKSDDKDNFGVEFDRALEAQNQKRFEEAASLWRQIREQYPDRSTIDYNLACAYALMGRTDLALEALRSAVEKGYDDVLWMRADADLAPLRVSAEYKTIERKAREKFIGSIKHYVQLPGDYDPQRKYGLLVHMGGAGSDGRDWLSMWELLKDHPLFRETIVITCEYLSDEPQGIYEKGWIPRNAFTLLQEMARDRWSIDSKRVVLGGFSAGAAMAMDASMAAPNMFPRALLIEGGSKESLDDPERARKAKEAGLRIAVLSGDAPGLFRTVSQLIVRRLQAEEIEHRYFTFPQERMHKIDRTAGPKIEEALQWLVGKP
jgi:predicted peptidase